MRTESSTAVIGAVLLLLTGFASIACSEVSIRKVPNRSDYRNWTDEDQRRVDSMCGKRVYGKRPYVEVKKPFVVASKSYLVDAVSSHDGKFLRIVGVRPATTSQEPASLQPPEHWTVDLARAGIEPSKVPFASVVKTPGLKVTTQDGNIASAQGASSITTRDGAVTAVAQGAETPGTIDPGALDSIEPHATAEDRPTGTMTYRLSTNMSAIGYKDLNDHFDLIYLPDFEEQYVISPINRLGAIDMSVTQGPGDEFLAMGMRVDNSAITRPLVDAYTDYVKSGAAAAKEAVGIAQGAAEDPTKALTAPDKLITLRMHVVKMATPGLYPILKASEMLENRHTPRDIRAQSYAARGPCGPQWEGRCKDLCETHVLPVYPYSRIAYQVHSTVIFEQLVTTETTRQLPAFSQGGAPQGKTGDPATIENLQGLINGVLVGVPAADKKCIDVKVVSFAPETATMTDIQTLVLRLNPVEGMAPAAIATCRDRIATYLKEQLPSLRNTNIQFED